MPSYDLNYDCLKKMPQLKFHILINLIILIFIIFIVIACNKKLDKQLKCYGIIENDKLVVQINEELSDIIKNNNVLTFNKTKMTYKIVEFGHYSFNDNNIMEEIILDIDKDVYNNEIGMVTISYGKQNIMQYIIDLFK